MILKRIVSVVVFFYLSKPSKSQDQTKSFGCQCGEAEFGAEEELRRRKRESLNSALDSIEKQLTNDTDVQEVDENLDVLKKLVQSEAKKDAGIHSRIVNGYEPRRRPWIVLIQIARQYNPDSKKRERNIPQCGGTIINKKFVLTAAHCFCVKMEGTNFGCTTGKSPNRIVPPMNAQQITVFIGQHDISRKMAYKKLIRKATDVVIYDTYARGKDDRNDLALVELANPIKRFSPSVMPACLPIDEEFQDNNIEAFVAGWGSLADKSCNTEDGGPNVHYQCTFPFLWKGQKHFHCSHSNTPSWENEKCKSLIERYPNIFEKDKSGVILKNETDSVITTCYSSHPGNYGWCGTCVRGAKRGEMGFCGKKRRKRRRKKKSSKRTKRSSERKRKRRRKIPAEFGKPTLDQHWGICDKQCTRNKPRFIIQGILQEAKLSTLSDELCKKFGGRMKADPDVELCAGAVKKSRGYKTYMFRSGKFTPKKAKNEEDKEVTIGGKDSCKGDSGGPLIAWKDKQAFLIGVVSRGAGCARHNEAGVYARVKMHLEWIKKYADSGKC